MIALAIFSDLLRNVVLSILCPGNISFDTVEKKEGRASRFKKENAISVSDTINTMMQSANKRGGEDVHFSDVHLVGSMTSLEKPYLRLTCVSRTWNFLLSP